MKKWAWGIAVALLIASLLCFSAAAETDYSALPEEYVALEEYVPEFLSSLLPEGLFARDPAQVHKALETMLSFSGLLGLLLRIAGMQLGENTALLVSVCGLLLLCGMMRSVGSAWGMSWASMAPRLCIFATIAGAGYAAISSVISYFSMLQTFMTGMLPLMSVMYLLGGNVARASVGNAALSVGLHVCNAVCAGMAPALFGTCMSMTLPGVLESGIDLSRLSAFLKKVYTIVLGILTLLLTLCLSAQNLIASRADSLAMRSGRYAIGQMIPIVGGALAGTLDTLAASVAMLRGMAGTCGVIVLLLCCMPALLRMLILRMLFDFGGSIAHLMGCPIESAILAEASSLFGYMAAAVAMCTAVFIIAVGAFAACAAAWVG